MLPAYDSNGTRITEKGQRIWHPKHGAGAVIRTESSGPGQPMHVRIGFDSGWIKRVTAHRCTLLKLGQEAPPVDDRPAFNPNIRSGEISREELLEAELADLRRRARAHRSSDVQAERIMGFIEEAVQLKPVAFEPAEYEPDGDSEHVHDLFLSDWHYGEVVDPEQVDGLNEFNVEVLRARVEEVYRGVLSFKAHRNYEIYKLHIALGGDMTSGGPGIHDEIRESNERVAAEQAIEVGALIADLIERLVPHYTEIEVVGVPGNHPRMYKPHASKNVFDNFDWVAYKYAEASLRGYDSVSCHFPRAGFLLQKVAGRNILLWHGDGVKTTMPGVPWGGVVRRTAELKKEYARRGVILDGFKVGHFHAPNVAGGVFMNGSLVGVNEFGLKNFGSGEPPCQLLMTWDASRSRLTDVSYITP